MITTITIKSRLQKNLNAEGVFNSSESSRWSSLPAGIRSLLVHGYQQSISTHVNLFYAAPGIDPYSRLNHINQLHGAQVLDEHLFFEFNIRSCPADAISDSAVDRVKAKHDLSLCAFRAGQVLKNVYWPSPQHVAEKVDVPSAAHVKAKVTDLVRLGTSNLEATTCMHSRLALLPT